MARPTVHHIKKSQRESLLLRAIAHLFQQTALDDSRLSSIFVNRVELSPDKGCCTVYFYTADGKQKFKELLEVLKLYKPSLRKALADSLKTRYTPELVFRFDEQFEKTLHIEKLFEKAKALDEQQPAYHEDDDNAVSS